MAGPYTKLDAAIVHSTIWREPSPTRCLWITMLALADRGGVVRASVPGLADIARVSLDECRAGLETLSSPDPDSRSPEAEGRRIVAIDGGWLLVNHGKYRDGTCSDPEREVAARRERQRRYRARLRGGYVDGDVDSTFPGAGAGSGSDQEGGPGETHLDEARAMERSRRSAVPPDGLAAVVPCPLCARELVLRRGKNGPWYAHPLGAGDPQHKWDAAALELARKAIAERPAEPPAEPPGRSPEWTCPTCGQHKCVRGEQCDACKRRAP